MNPSKLQPWDFAEPQRLMNDIAAAATLRPHRPVLTLVADAFATCQLLGVTPVEVVAPTHWHDAASVLRTTAERLPLSNDGEGARLSLLLVLPRFGRVVFGPKEEYYLRACRYINLARPIMGPEVVLVTEHGWRFSLQSAYGAVPNLMHHDALQYAL